MRAPPEPSAAVASLASPALVMREKRNWLIHMLYVRHDMDECLALIEEQLKECAGLCEYAIYVKGGCAGRASAPCNRPHHARLPHPPSAAASRMRRLPSRLL
jgi:hypothetical protein